MAKKQDTAQNQTNTFIKGLNKDSNPSFVTEGMWTHARNAVNNTAEGDLGTLSNVPALLPRISSRQGVSINLANLILSQSKKGVSTQNSQLPFVQSCIH